MHDKPLDHEELKDLLRAYFPLRDELVEQTFKRAVSPALVSKFTQLDKKLRELCK